LTWLVLHRFPPDLRLTPEQFALLCAENREAVLELAADGRRSIEPTRCRSRGVSHPIGTPQVHAAAQELLSKR